MISCPSFLSRGIRTHHQMPCERKPVSPDPSTLGTQEPNIVDVILVVYLEPNTTVNVHSLPCLELVGFGGLKGP